MITSESTLRTRPTVAVGLLPFQEPVPASKLITRPAGRGRGRHVERAAFGGALLAPRWRRGRFAQPPQQPQGADDLMLESTPKPIRATLPAMMPAPWTETVDPGPISRFVVAVPQREAVPIAWPRPPGCWDAAPGNVLAVRLGDESWLSVSPVGLGAAPCGAGDGASRPGRTTPMPRTAPSHREQPSGQVKRQNRKSSLTSWVFWIMKTSSSPTPVSVAIAPPPRRRPSAGGLVLSLDSPGPWQLSSVWGVPVEQALYLKAFHIPNEAVWRKDAAGGNGPGQELDDPPTPTRTTRRGRSTPPSGLLAPAAPRPPMKRTGDPLSWPWSQPSGPPTSHARVTMRVEHRLATIQPAEEVRHA